MSVPALRFKEFSGDWEVKKLGDLCATFKSGSGITSEHIGNHGDYPVYGGNGLRGYTDSFTHEGFYLLIGRQGALCGNINRSFGKAYISEHAIAVCANETSNTEWLSQKLNLLNLNRLSESSAQPGLAVNKLIKLEFEVPSLPEQTKIANFLTAVDKKISLLTQKADLLFQYKKGVMQQIFNQELRFKDDDGQEFPEWEDMPADKIFISVSNKNHNGDLPILAATQDKGMIYREDSGLDIKSTEASIKSYKIVEKGDFVISLRSFQGGIEYSSLMGICSPAYTVMKAKIELNNGFFKAFLKKEDFIEKLNGLVIGIRDGKQISYSAFATLTLPYPNIKEQTKIANFLTAIDEKITNNQNQLNAVKQYKQGLLQQMFV